MGKILTFIMLVLFPSAISNANEQRYTVPLENSPCCYTCNNSITIFEFLDYQ